MLSLAYDGLVAYRRVPGAGGSTIVPDLATSVPEPTDGGRTYTFQLRSGLRFSDGAPVRPEDFRASIERLVRLAGRDVPYWTGIVGGQACSARRCDLSKGIETDAAARTIVIHLRRPDAEFMHKLAIPMAVVLPSRAPSMLIRGRSPPGTGPYTIDAFTTRRGARLVRNARFRSWSPDARPDGFADRIAVTTAPGASAQVAPVRAGRADAIVAAGSFSGEVPVDQGRVLALGAADRVSTAPEPFVTYLFLNTREPPFDDVRVRRALNYAVDRRRMVELAGGSGVAGLTCQVIPPGLPGYVPTCPFTSAPTRGGGWSAPDLARARRLVAASGSRGARVRVFAGPKYPGIGHYTGAALRRLGYRVRVRVLQDFDGYSRYIADTRHHVQVGIAGWVDDSSPRRASSIRSAAAVSSLAPAPTKTQRSSATPRSTPPPTPPSPHRARTRTPAGPLSTAACWRARRPCRCSAAARSCTSPIASATPRSIRCWAHCSSSSGSDSADVQREVLTIEDHGTAPANSVTDWPSTAVQAIDPSLRRRRDALAVCGSAWATNGGPPPWRTRRRSDALRPMQARTASARYPMAMADRPLAEPGVGGRVADARARFSSRYRRTSLYVRVVVINAAIVAGATVVLVLTPATVGYPISLTEAIVLVVGVLFVVVANALVLRISFGGPGADGGADGDRRSPAIRRSALPLVGGPETRAVVAGLNQMLARLEAERRESSRRTLAALEGERRRIAQELHDEIGQRLTGMLLQLGNLVPDAPPELRDRIGRGPGGGTGDARRGRRARLAAAAGHPRRPRPPARARSARRVVSRSSRRTSALRQLAAGRRCRRSRRRPSSRSTASRRRR